MKWKSFLFENAKFDSFLRLAEIIEDDERDLYVRLKKYQNLISNLFGDAWNAGSFRAVYPFEDDKVLKLVDDPSHAYMNKAEASAALQSKYSDLIPKVYHSDRDHLYIIVERVKPLFSFDLKGFFPYLASLVPFGNAALTMFLRYAKMRIKDPSNLDKLTKMASDFPFIAHVDDKDKADVLFSAIKEEPLMIRLAEMAAEFNMDVSDLVAKNLGYAMHDGKKQLKVLDVSIFASHKDEEAGRQFEVPVSSKYSSMIKDFMQKFQGINAAIEDWKNIVGTNVEIQFQLGRYALYDSEVIKTLFSGSGKIPIMTNKMGPYVFITVYSPFELHDGNDVRRFLNIVYNIYIKNYNLWQDKLNEISRHGGRQ